MSESPREFQGVDEAARARAAPFLERLCKFRHAHVLAVEGWTCRGDVLALAVASPQHVTLSTWLEREHRLPFLECGRVLAESAAALHAAHAAGFVHGALVPACVLWTDLHVQVDGFGRLQLRALLAGAAAAPDELVRAEDVRAWGAVAYQVLTGAAHAVGRPPPNALREHVPPGLAALVVRALDAEPPRRPSAADLARFTRGLVTPPANLRAPMLVRQARYLFRTEDPPWPQAEARVARALALDPACSAALELAAEIRERRRGP